MIECKSIIQHVTHITPAPMLLAWVANCCIINILTLPLLFYQIFGVLNSISFNEERKKLRQGKAKQQKRYSISTFCFVKMKCTHLNWSWKRTLYLAEMKLVNGNLLKNIHGPPAANMFSVFQTCSKVRWFLFFSKTYSLFVFLCVFSKILIKITFECLLF